MGKISRSKIFFISYFLPPLLSPQSIQVARILKYLKENTTFDIEVVTGNYWGGAKDRSLYPDIFSGLKVHRVNNAEWGILSVLRYKISRYFGQCEYIDNYVNWNEQVFAYLKRQVSIDKDTVVLTFACPYSSNVLGKKIKDYFQNTWISFNSDPWSMNSHMTNSGEILIAKLEEDCFEKADKLVFTSAETAHMYTHRYPRLAAKIDFMDHSYDPFLYENEVIQKKSNKIVMSYIGTFYGRRTPQPLLEAFMLLSPLERQKFLIQFVGCGYLGLLKRLWPYRILKKHWRIFPRVSYRESLKIMRQSDILLLIDADQEGTSVFFPSKLVDYIGSGRPILGITPLGTSERIINEVHGKSFRNKDVEGIVSYLKAISKEQLPQLDPQEIKKFKTENILPKILEILKI